MGLWDNIKNIMTIPEEDDFDEDIVEIEEEAPKKKTYEEEAYNAKKENTPKIFQGGKSKTISYSQNQMQVVLVKPDRFEDVTAIADHLNEKKTVVLNLEAANREVSRRIIDFLSGAAYANHGNMRKVANSTFIIVPTSVDVMGELMLEDFEDGRMYF
ncbi:MAG: cell division protein SepF [Ruminococcaceae bacterium]|nr:cell division protein SepF [Oscillospiraceae bacterium]